MSLIESHHSPGVYTVYSDAAVRSSKGRMIFESFALYQREGIVIPLGIIYCGEIVETGRSDLKMNKNCNNNN